MHSRILVLALALMTMEIYGAPAQKKTVTPPPPFYQGEILTDSKYAPAYNAPARIDLHSQNPVRNVNLSVSFIYWNASEDGMVLASSGDFFDAVGSYPPPKTVFLMQPFEYSPGFKIGLGYGIKDWEIAAEYTWIRNHSFIRSEAAKNPTFGAEVGATPVWLPYFFTVSVPTPVISSTWDLHIDWIDATASRPYYESKMIVLSPYAGLRTLLIRQSLRLAALINPFFGGYGLAPQSVSTNRVNSWGIGPVLGSHAQFLLGAGFRIEADAGASFLFTQYTSIGYKQSNISPEIYDGTTINNKFIKTKIVDYDCVRPVANLGLGVGWGSYLRDGKYHFDISADYDFNILWDQNMMQSLYALYETNGFPSNDLFLQGLTLKTQFNF